MSYNNNAKIVNDGLVAYYDAANLKSYPGGGNSWYDLTGNNNTVTLTNSPTWNSAGYFSTGATGYFTGAGTSTIPTGNSSYCIGVWARQPSTWGINYGFISIGDFGTNNQSNSLRTANNTPGNFHHYWWNNDLTATVNNQNLALNVWFHVLAQFDGTTRSIWVNGVRQVSDTPSSHNVTTTTVLISKTYSSEYQQGDMAAAFIYNRALTQNEILRNYNAMKSKFRSP